MNIYEKLFQFINYIFYKKYIKAICVLQNGYIEFNEMVNNEININIVLNNLKPYSIYSFHIHENGDLRNIHSNLNNIYTPFRNESLNLKYINELTNVILDKDGNLNIEMNSKLIKLRNNSSIIGRSLIIYEGFHCHNNINNKIIDYGIIGYTK